MTTSTDFETQVKLVHSHGPDNKNPDFDLGGQPSQFEIAVEPQNNLFSDVTPEEADEGMVDWRCIYVVNKKQNTVVKELTITVSNPPYCTSICVGTRLENDMQIISCQGEAEAGGYIILATEFGGPFTCKFDGDWTNFRTEIENKIRLTRWCENVTVTLLGLLAGGGAQYLVEFKGTVRNRLVKPMTLVQNNLVSIRGPENRVANYKVTDTFNQEGETTVKVIWPIPTDDLPLPGTVHLFNPQKNNVGGFEHLEYIGFSPPYMFTLASPLTWNLVPGDEVWFDVPSQIRCTVDIRKYQDGWPIGQYAEFLDTKTDTPSVTSCTSVLSVGMLRPQESCYVWVKRETTDKGCKVCFDMNVTGDEETLRAVSMTPPIHMTPVDSNPQAIVVQPVVISEEVIRWRQETAAHQGRQVGTPT